MILSNLLPPEKAHALALWGVKNGLIPRYKNDQNLETQIKDIIFKNPIGLSAGADKAACALKGWDTMGFGFIEAGTVTRHPRKGNPKPRLWRKQGGKNLINWLGLPGNGIDAFEKNLKSYKDNPRQNFVVGVSIATPENNMEDLSYLGKKCAPYADYLTLNISCPNAESHDSVISSLKNQISAVKEGAADIPLFIKFGPTKDKDLHLSLIDTAMKNGAFGLIMTNTLPYEQNHLLKQPIEKWPKRKGNHVGGYSGRGLLHISEQMIKWSREIVSKDTPIIGVGGIQSGADALRLINAGADLIQLYTGLVYKGPRLLKEIKDALRENISNAS